MGKLKKKVVQEAENEASEDSMIDNGTSEDSDATVDESIASAVGEDSADADSDEDEDDGFSEREEELTEKSATPPATSKRKASTATATTPNIASTAKKPKKDEKVKPPTLQEMNELKETRNLFHSNLFRLQVKEMLTELKVKEKYKSYINNWLEKFKTFLSNLESQPAKEDMHKMQWLRKCPLQVPLALNALCIQQQKPFQFQFVKPNAPPYLLGAAATQTLLGPKLVADICVPMPAECFQKENYLNLVYDQKRAYYLTYLGNELLKHSAEFGELTQEQLQFNYYANNPLKPVLEITPPVGAGKSFVAKLCIRLFVAAEERCFKLNRFVPWNNNVRASLFTDEEDSEHALPLATPNYNAGVLFDLTMERNQQLLHETFDAHPNFQEGLVLLKVWLRQRQLDIGYCGFQPHLLSMYIVYLFKQRRLHSKMSSYQIARNVWNNLALSNWDENGKGITLCNSSITSNDNNQPTLEQCHTYYDVVFIDSTGFLNMTANLSIDMYQRVRLESKLAVEMLNDMKLNSFQQIFMTKCPLYSQFDHILKINKADAIEQILSMHVAPADKYNFAGYTYPQLLKVVLSLLRKGLGQRVRTLLPIEQSVESWPANTKPPACSEHLHLGLILNPEQAFEVLDKGPESIDESAEEFRKFWGDKAQLRRFQDGSIAESVVWAAADDTLLKKRQVVRYIVSHLLQHHFQLEDQDFDYIASELDVVYRLTPAFKTDKLFEKFKVPQDTDAEAASLYVIRAFDDLARKLHNLNELPLEIVTIAGTSPVFRYCEPEPVLPQARYIGDRLYAMQVQRGVMQLGLSGKWPSELAALRALKTAFYIQIAQLLREKHRLHTSVTYDGILVLTRGFCFMLELAHPKEVALLKKEKNERGITQYVDCEASIALEKRHYILPKVNGALRSLYQQYASFGGSVMIAKRWLYAQLIDDGLWPDECTELLIASQFLKTHALQLTCSPQTGFIRFLQLLAYTDWKTELFLLNFNSAMDENAIAELEQRFNTERDTFPPLCIVTSYDQRHSGLLWSSHSRPNVNVLARVTLLARQTLNIIETSILSTEPFIKPSKIFIAPNEGYDLVIQLKPDMVPNTLAYEFGSTFASLGKPNWRLPLADMNFLKEAVTKLREAYSDFAAFFYNACGGKEIAVVWKPNIFSEKDFKVNEVHGCALSANNPKKVVVRKDVFIEDFKFILKDLYLRIGTVDTVLSESRNSANASKSAVQHSRGTNRYFAHQSTKHETNGISPKAETKLKHKIKPPQRVGEKKSIATKSKTTMKKKAIPVVTRKKQKTLI